MIWALLTTVRGFLAKIPWQVWLVLAVLLSAWLWGNHRYDQGVDRERGRWEAAAAEAKARANASTITAAERRSTDTIRNTEAERARTDAIAANPDDPYRALACQRLRSRPGFDPVASGCGR